VLVNGGSEGALTESSPNGTAIFHVYVDSGFLSIGAQNYRAYRYNWTGISHEEPAIAAFSGGEAMSIFVSWNGDTETTERRFFGKGVNGDPSIDHELGRVRRRGFETSLTVTIPSGTEVWAGAYSGELGLIGITEWTTVKPAVCPQAMAHIMGGDGRNGQQPVHAFW
jgi:hypothetical protein